MATWHSRLQSALTVRGKSWADLVDVAGLTLPSVRAWYPLASKRTTMMNGDNAARVCAFLQINPLWLFDDVGPSGLEIGTTTADKPFSATSDEIEIVKSLRALPSFDNQAVSRIIDRLADKARQESMHSRGGLINEESRGVGRCSHL